MIASFCKRFAVLLMFSGILLAGEEALSEEFLIFLLDMESAHAEPQPERVAWDDPIFEEENWSLLGAESSSDETGEATNTEVDE